MKRYLLYFVACCLLAGFMAGCSKEDDVFDSTPPADSAARAEAASDSLSAEVTETPLDSLPAEIEVVENEGFPALNEIWYTSMDGKAIEKLFKFY